MKISTDDWHFRSCDSDTVVLDVFLSNGQHALLEASPMRNPDRAYGHIPEMVVYCEFPGEKLHDQTGVARWVSRPPDKSCPWSNVEIPPALLQQIRERMNSSVFAHAPVAA